MLPCDYNANYFQGGDCVAYSQKAHKVYTKVKVAAVRFYICWVVSSLMYHHIPTANAFLQTTIQQSFDTTRSVFCEILYIETPQSARKGAACEVKVCALPLPSLSYSLSFQPQIAKFMGPTWGPPGSCRSQMGPVLALWTLLSGKTILICQKSAVLGIWNVTLCQYICGWGTHWLCSCMPRTVFCIRVISDSYSFLRHPRSIPIWIGTEHYGICAVRLQFVWMIDVMAEKCLLRYRPIMWENTGLVGNTLTKGQ